MESTAPSAPVVIEQPPPAIITNGDTHSYNAAIEDEDEVCFVIVMQK